MWVKPCGFNSHLRHKKQSTVDSQRSLVISHELSVEAIISIKLLLGPYNFINFQLYRLLWRYRIDGLLRRFAKPLSFTAHMGSNPITSADREAQDMRIYIFTTNQQKLRTAQRVLGQYGVDLQILTPSYELPEIHSFTVE